MIYVSCKMLEAGLFAQRVDTRFVLWPKSSLHSIKPIVFTSKRISKLSEVVCLILHSKSLYSLDAPDSDDDSLEEGNTGSTKDYPLGIAACDPEKALICYRTFGAFINFKGKEDHQVKWRIPAHQAAFAWPYVLLFSHDKIEVRNISTGTYIQTIETLEMMFGVL
ncbi:hypothetical protein DL96DRAFT_753690 [Flagelloscypha sp. PMI_526]|nr:hypothetical protein DL96DRAFT_753690 [Flagelloscypha sp. PMI_526]